MDRAGRKALLVLSSVGMTVSSCVLTFAMVLGPMLQIELGYLEIFGVLLYVAFFEFGLGPIPWAITAELFGAVERATAMGACSCINWVASFLVGLLFPAVNAALGSYTFLPFALVTLVASFFSYYIVPETKGKSHKEIEAEMFGGRQGASSSISGYSVVGSRNNNRLGSESSYGGGGGGAPRHSSASNHSLNASYSDLDPNDPTQIVIIKPMKGSDDTANFSQHGEQQLGAANSHITAEEEMY
mmetsp:Transcript_8756/g.12042  ORF Transcript_8756/g.12042 Transcript_8756/m.12042 type:complete len:243 (+) Transcript_8756:3-731(+)